MRTIPNVTGAAELNQPETNLICVREKLWYLVFQSIPNNASGKAALEALQNLLYMPSLNFFHLIRLLDVVHWPANSIHPGPPPSPAGLLFYCTVVMGMLG